MSDWSGIFISIAILLGCTHLREGMKALADALRASYSRDVILNMKDGAE